MEFIYKPIIVQHGTNTKKVYININLVESIQETTTGVHIRMHQGSSWIVNEPLHEILERLQSK
jgi:uncharacterized protein YlzI (FlbEa/FlbD family)